MSAGSLLVVAEKVKESDVSGRLQKVVAAWSVGCPDDARTLAISRNSSGHRQRTFKDAAGLMKQVEFFDWPISGPRATAYVIQEFARLGVDPLTRHGMWRVEWGLNLEDKQTLAGGVPRSRHWV